MKHKKLLHYLGISLLSVLLLISCYGEDVSELYSRQYVNSVSLKQVQDLADQTNQQINNLVQLYKVLDQRHPVAQVVPNTDSTGREIGVFVTFDTTTIYIPYGRDGKDGINGTNGTNGTNGKDGVDGKDGTNGKDGVDGKDGKDGADGKEVIITIGENGNWYINGIDTQRPARGEKGDKGDTGDTGATGAQGEKGDKGDKGDTGATGAQGEKGDKGDKGDTGATGAQGEKGDKGDTGATGANGADGLTPVISAKPNPDDPTDTNLYWYISWPDGTGSYLRVDGQLVRATGTQGEKGDKGDKGDTGETGAQGPQGVPGVDSPLRTVVENDSAYVFTLYYPATGTTPERTETITIPKAKDIRFDIHPDQARLFTRVNAQGDTVYTVTPSRFNAEQYTYTLNLGERLILPYTHDIELEAVYATLPTGWSYQVDTVAKTFTLIAPSVSAAPYLLVNGQQGTFFARTETGNTYSRLLNLQLNRLHYWGYFYHHAHSQSFNSESPLHPENEFSLLRTSAPMSHYQFFFKQDGNGWERYSQSIEDDLEPTSYTSYLRQYAPFNIPITYERVSAVDLLFHNNGYIGTVNRGATDANRRAGTPTQLGYSGVFWRTETNAVLQSDLTQPTNSSVARAAYIHPVPKDVYRALTYVTHTENKSTYSVNRLYRVPMHVVLKIKNARKHLTIPDGEVIDVSRMEFMIPSLYYVLSNGTMIGDRYSSGGIIATRATNVATYDADNDLLTVDFYCLPSGSSKAQRVRVKYTTSTGAVINRVTDVWNIKEYAGEGGEIRVLVDIPYTMSNGNTTYQSSYIVKPAGDLETVSPFVGMRAVNNEDEF